MLPICRYHCLLPQLCLSCRLGAHTAPATSGIPCTRVNSSVVGTHGYVCMYVLLREGPRNSTNGPTGPQDAQDVVGAINCPLRWKTSALVKIRTAWNAFWRLWRPWRKKRFLCRSHTHDAFVQTFKHTRTQTGHVSDHSRVVSPTGLSDAARARQLRVSLLSITTTHTHTHNSRSSGHQRKNA